MPWVNDYSPGMVKFVGAAELIGAIGLILPQATGIATILTPLAAVGLAVIMVLATIHHSRKGETQGLITTVILLALSIFVAVGRF
jgi:putative exporter of polyketide antibiotics